MKEVLDFLQTVYSVRLDPKDIPSSLRNPFYKAVDRFQEPGVLKNLDRSKMGICEEVADVTYQVLKLICIEQKILTEETIRTLQDYLEGNHYYDNEGKLVSLDYGGLDGLSTTLVPENMVKELRSRLPDALFSPRDNGCSIIRDFLGGQFVAYISRIWRGHAMGGLQAAEHMRDKKIPEEARELAEALGSAYEPELSKCVAVVVRESKTDPLLILLSRILKEKIIKPVTVEDTLHLMFLKMKGRQELDFMGVPEQTMRYICKPVEYLIEADMFL